ncbi:MAG: hypothetical protein K1X71_04425 [Pirellulales bacterium]|nr:hypothetical protein [Pirellulales bacterium]
MGTFLSITGLATSEQSEVTKALAHYAAKHEIGFEPTSDSYDEENMLLLHGGLRCSIVHPNYALDWEDVARELSSLLKVPALTLHIHDDDLWMYVLFLDGERFDQFNPLPEYWEELSTEEAATWDGNSNRFAAVWPDASAEQLGRYLIRWSDESTEKAYPDDEFPAGNPWQMVDFMRRLGLDYPFDREGAPQGKQFLWRKPRRGRRHA